MKAPVKLWDVFAVIFAEFVFLVKEDLILKKKANVIENCYLTMNYDNLM